MIDHSVVLVSNFEHSKVVYQKALAPLKYKLLEEYSGEGPESIAVAGYGVPTTPDFWISTGTPHKPGIHIAFRAENRKMVDEFHKSALNAVIMS